jgi:hypothetical protein
MADTTLSSQPVIAAQALPFHGPHAAQLSQGVPSIDMASPLPQYGHGLTIDLAYRLYPQEPESSLRIAGRGLAEAKKEQNSHLWKTREVAPRFFRRLHLAVAMNSAKSSPDWVISDGSMADGRLLNAAKRAFCRIRHRK